MPSAKEIFESYEMQSSTTEEDESIRNRNIYEAAKLLVENKMSDCIFHAHYTVGNTGWFDKNRKFFRVFRNGEIRR